jgi:hypothetical protein
MYSRCSGSTGAMPKPQLVRSTEVKPCQQVGVASGSQKS